MTDIDARASVERAREAQQALSDLHYDAMMKVSADLAAARATLIVTQSRAHGAQEARIRGDLEYGRNSALLANDPWTRQQFETLRAEERSALRATGNAAARVDELEAEQRRLNELLYGSQS